MRFLATFEKLTEDGHLILKLNDKAKEIVSSAFPAEYEVEMNRKTKDRTLQQNALLWKIIGDINYAENGSKKTEDDVVIYKNILRMAGVGTTTVMIDKNAVGELEKFYRLVEVIDQTGECCICKCYMGTSQMDSIQMSAVIDTALSYAESIGLDPMSY